MKVRLCRILPVVLLLAAISPATAALIRDPKPAFTWDDMTRSELIVVGKYEKHVTLEEKRGTGNESDPKQTLSLRITRVLRGANMKAGDVVDVELRHWYTIETGNVGFLPSARPVVPDGVPKLCYKSQVANPGPLLPYRAVNDVREDAIYFFPNAAAPALERKGQVRIGPVDDGLQLALDGKPAPLLFRLTQLYSTSMRRDAIEELQRQPDPAIVDKLFEWLKMPPMRAVPTPASPILIGLAPSHPEFYERASRLLEAAPRNETHETLISYMKIMAAADSERAARDLAALVEQGDITRVSVAATGLIETRTDYALEAALKWAQDPEWRTNTRRVEAGLNVLLSLLHPPGMSANAGWRDIRPATARLRRLAAPRLGAILKLPFMIPGTADIPPDLSWLAERRRTLEWIAATIAEPPPFDLARAEQVLVHPGEFTHKQSQNEKKVWVEGEGTLLLTALREEADLRVIPLLVTMLRSGPKVWSHGNFQEILLRHVTLFPNAFKRELARQEVALAEFEQEPLKNYGFLERTAAMLGRSSFADSITVPPASYLRSDDSWIMRHAATPQLLASVAAQIDKGIDTKQWFRVNHLYFLQRADAKLAAPLLQRALAARAGMTRRDRAMLLVVAISTGQRDLLPELLDSFKFTAEEEKKYQEKVEQSAPFWRTPNVGALDRPDALVLLWTNDPQALQAYLKMLDIMPKVQSRTQLNSLDDYWDWSGFDTSPSYLEGVKRLYPQHNSEYFPRVLALLKSADYLDRQAGQKLLQYALEWNLGFQANDFANVRAERLRTIEPLLLEFATMSELQIRVRLLRELGVVLPQEPKAHLEAVVKAAGDFDTAISRNALQLLEAATGETGLVELETLPALVKVRAIASFLADRGLTASKVAGEQLIVEGGLRAGIW